MKQGFTLVELLVVILIIGVLSAIAVPEYSRSLEKARAAELAVNLNGIMEADRMWADEMGYTVGYGTWREFYYVPDFVCQNGGRDCQSKFFTYQLDMTDGTVSGGALSIAHGRRMSDDVNYRWAVRRNADGTHTVLCSPADDGLGKEICENLVKTQGWKMGSVSTGS